ncbi:class I SAM-dependent methyltransferase [Gordonia pseudamarae]|uniref:Class I SAM-dependent methyltransferase n=1 Tax=Gordonia pseudamarae TaxID=2831662 RepID=A0ABX6IKZ0_9ACTN|nr:MULTISPECIES: class I SAM-dependent methyltransferase [Gordonia]MBD0023172.1 class I SAM-dependent methyltransferase [Gordonia sp. (in: high G+C Gram-positive bacteria)]QHN27116.1 class I SAM-dependent methyltransferase [Gordonia pseudamarae]QHN36006.1 class I SAM-dependent methyltransferase [Gordonia pseudamarae]
MGYSFTADDVAFLRSGQGHAALRAASSLPLSPASMIADIGELRGRYTPFDAALIETVTCRRRARTKLRHADDLLLTDDAVQQATAWPVAQARSVEIVRRYPDAVVHDVTCSVGAELVELSSRLGVAGVIGSDIDPVRVAMAAHNAGTVELSAPTVLLRADALTRASSADVVLADPARRTGSGRVFRLDQLTPSLFELFTVYAGRPLVVKCAPGLDHQNLREQFGFDGEAQVTSLDGGVRETCLWSGPGTRPVRRATVLRSGEGGAVARYEITDDTDDDVPSAEPGEWIIDPDGAIVRAGLVRHYAHRHGLWQLDPQIAYLTGDSVPEAGRGFRIIGQTTVSDKVLRKALHTLDCGALEILVRGLDVDPDALRKRLKPKGTRPLSLVLTRIGRKGVAFICEPGVRGER